MKKNDYEDTGKDINEVDHPYMLDDKSCFGKLCSETLKVPAPRVEAPDSDEKTIKLNKKPLQQQGTKDEIKERLQQQQQQLRRRWVDLTDSECS